MIPLNAVYRPRTSIVLGPKDPNASKLEYLQSLLLTALKNEIKKRFPKLQKSAVERTAEMQLDAYTEEVIRWENERGN